MNNDKFDKALRKFFDELLHETYISDKVQSLPPSQRNKEITQDIIGGSSVIFYDCNKADRDRNYSGSEKYYSIGTVIKIRTTQPLYLPINDIFLPGGEVVVDIELSDGRISKGHFITGVKQPPPIK